MRKLPVILLKRFRTPLGLYVKCNDRLLPLEYCLNCKNYLNMQIDSLALLKKKSWVGYLACWGGRYTRKNNLGGRKNAVRAFTPR